MYLDVERVDVWAAPIEDRPGGLATLLKGLHRAGANLRFIIARRSPEKPGTGVVFVTPLQGDREIKAATDLGFNLTQSLHSIRVMGLDKPGVTAEIAQVLADAGINLRGLTGSTIGSQFVAYIGVDSVDDVTKAIDALNR